MAAERKHDSKNSILEIEQVIVRLLARQAAAEQFRASDNKITKQAPIESTQTPVKSLIRSCKPEVDG